jgi:hypothetical protein
MDATETRTVDRDGLNQGQARCPECGQWADLDQDQLEGSCSLICECGWHGYVAQVAA